MVGYILRFSMTQAQMKDWLKEEVDRIKNQQELEALSGSEWSEAIAAARLRQTQRILNRLFPE